MPYNFCINSHNYFIVNFQERKVEEIFYDSELDIFAVLTKDHNDFFSCPPNACLEIYDNETCTYLRSIDVDIPDNAVCILNLHFILLCT